MKVGFISLGCPKNQVDTEIMMGTASEQHTLVTEVKNADAVIINTCGFITAAKEEAINTILDTAEQLTENQLLLVTGCLAQRYAVELKREMPEIDGLMGVGNPRRINELIHLAANGERPQLVESEPTRYQEEGPRILSTPNGWAYLKIAEGCHNRCSYCAIPLIRGNLRCRSWQSILAEAKLMVNQGSKEIVLIAQDTTAYRDEEFDLSRLVTEIDKIEGLEWVRILYAHPRQMTTEIIETMAACKTVVPYLDLPIQHSDNNVLKRMHRNYQQDQLWSTIEQLRSIIPEIVLRTTVMVGFPGESESEFAALQEFISAVKFNWLGAFAYCQEEGTVSAGMVDDVLPEVKNERLHTIESLQQTITVSWLKTLLGKSFPVLLEAPWRNGMRGRAYFQAPEIDNKILLPNAINQKYGSIIQVKMKKLRGLDLVGEIDQ